MARDLTAEELVALRGRLQAARTAPNSTTQIGAMLPVLEALVEAMGESADLTAIARKRFDEAQKQ